MLFSVGFVLCVVLECHVLLDLETELLLRFCKFSHSLKKKKYLKKWKICFNMLQVWQIMKISQGNPPLSGFHHLQCDCHSWTGFEACAVPDLTVVLVCYQPHRAKSRGQSLKRWSRFLFQLPPSHSNIHKSFLNVRELSVKYRVLLTQGKCHRNWKPPLVLLCDILPSSRIIPRWNSSEWEE